MVLDSSCTRADAVDVDLRTFLAELGAAESDWLTDVDDLAKKLPTSIRSCIRCARAAAASREVDETCLNVRTERRRRSMS